MKKKKITLKQTIDFHGHLGPYLVLGLRMGEYALKKLEANPYFGLEVKVWGAKDKPRSCLIDGLQLSTGCTYGKGNITKYSSKIIKAKFTNCDSKEGVELYLQNKVINRLKSVFDHKSSEKLAKELYKTKPEELFKFTPLERTGLSNGVNPVRDRKRLWRFRKLSLLLLCISNGVN